jgi:thiamine biosynthesis protein ThiS
VIRVGDRELPWREGLTVAELLAESGEGGQCVVVRVNDEYVSRKHFGTARIPDGANIFFIYMVAGG